jgi:hypothetical protein
MAWFRVDDSFGSHPKVRSIPRRTRMATIGVWTVCGNWAAHHLTDGLVPADAVEDEGGTQADALRLVAARLWHAGGHDCPRCPDPGPGAFQFHDWPDYQRMRVDVLAEREAAAERMRKARAKRRPPPDGYDGSSGERPPQQPPNERPNFGRSSGNPDPTRPDPSKSSSGPDPSSSSVPEREIDDAPTTRELIDRGAGRLAPPELAIEATAFLAHNAGRWTDLHDWRRAWSGWLTKAAERNRPTPTPGTPSCPLHPDQPTGSRACPRCVAEATPAPSLRELRDKTTREAS